MIDTSGAFVAGYTVAAVIMAAYVLSLWVRMRRVRARLREHGEPPANVSGGASRSG